MAILSCIRPVDRPALAIATNRPDVPSRRAHMPRRVRSILLVMHVILPCLGPLASMFSWGFLLAGMGVPGCLMWWG